MEKIIAGIVMVVGLVIVALAIGFLMSYPVMLLWNGCLVPAVTVLQPVTWLQAWGIVVVCSFLFKSNVSTSQK